MAGSARTVKSADAAKELLMADYAYLRDSFWKNEEAGERRVQFYATLVTAVITALVAINGMTGIQDKELRLLLSLYALFSLLVLGIVTLFRIMQRNKVSDGYKKDMDTIRQRVKALYDEQKVLAGYLPLRRSGDKMFSLRKFGGLSYTVAAINSVLISALCGIAAYAQKSPVSASGGLIQPMIGYFIAAFTAQTLIILRADWKSKAKLYRSDCTHAGGVVVRFDDKGEPRYLLVKSKNNAYWVLPKGHIEKRENPAEAAVREVEEEAGVKATVIDSIGTSRYQIEQDAISVQFFLMVYSRPSEWPAEKREQDWLHYKEASKKLKFENAKVILKKADRMVAALTSQ